MMNDRDLCAWLRENSAGAYRPAADAAARIEQLEAQVARLFITATQVLSDIDDDGVAERHDMGVLALRRAAAQTSTQPPARDEFVAGIVYACARLIEVADQPVYAEDILVGAGIDASLGLEDDLVFIRKIEKF